MKKKINNMQFVQYINTVPTRTGERGLRAMVYQRDNGVSTLIASIDATSRLDAINAGNAAVKLLGGQFARVM